MHASTELPAKHGLILTLRIMLPFALGYYLSYIFRVVNAVLVPDLTSDLGIGPEELGLLTAVYFISFAAFQLPLGVLLDRYGPRRVEAWLLLFAAAGSFLFAFSESFEGLMLGRALIGFGVSACLMASFKVVVDWFPSHRLPQMNGIIMASGGLGALTASTPVEMALALTDWRGIFMALGVFTILVAALVMFMAPDRTRDGAGTLTFRVALKGVAQVLKDRYFWHIAPLTMLSQASYIALQSLWAAPWLRDIAGFERASIAHVLLLMAVAMVAGNLFMGWLASRLYQRGISPSMVGVGGCLVFISSQALIFLEIASLAFPLWVLFGFFGVSGILQYSALSQAYPVHLAGRVNASINLMVFLTSFSVQTLFGVIINQFPVGPDGGYDPLGYKWALGLLIVAQIMAVLWYCATRHIQPNKDAL